MTFKALPYPDILTNSNWQKNKSMIAKMAGETGIGDLMKTAEAGYKGRCLKQVQFIPAWRWRPR